MAEEERIEQGGGEDGGHALPAEIGQDLCRFAGRELLDHIGRGPSLGARRFGQGVETAADFTQGKLAGAVHGQRLQTYTGHPLP